MRQRGSRGWKEEAAPKRMSLAFLWSLRHLQLEAGTRGCWEDAGHPQHHQHSTLGVAAGAPPAPYVHVKQAGTIPSWKPFVEVVWALWFGMWRSGTWGMWGAGLGMGLKLLALPCYSPKTCFINGFSCHPIFFPFSLAHTYTMGTDVSCDWNPNFSKN